MAPLQSQKQEKGAVNTQRSEKCCRARRPLPSAPSSSPSVSSAVSPLASTLNELRSSSYEGTKKVRRRCRSEEKMIFCREQLEEHQDQQHRSRDADYYSSRSQFNRHQQHRLRDAYYYEHCARAQFSRYDRDRDATQSAASSRRKRQRQSSSFNASATRSSPAAGLLIILLIYSSSTLLSHAAVSCDPTSKDNNECATLLRPGSECSPDGFCTNPFQQGCLRNYLGTEQFSALRTCNSDDLIITTTDDGNNKQQQLCTPSPLGYSEIRILTQNWETPMFTAWILQIVLSELLQVPATLELSGPGRELNFYSPTNAFDYGAVGYDFDSLRRANDYLADAPLVTPTLEIQKENSSYNGGKKKKNNKSNAQGGTVGDCPKDWRVPPSDVIEQESWTYQSCAHVMTEVWSGQAPSATNLTLEKVTEPPEGTGVVAKLGWFLPKYLAAQDPSLTHWLGLTGEANRRRVAETFKVPTTFGQFCTEIVPHNCTVPTLFTSRPPRDDAEATKYYVPGGVFQGYFRMTPENDCDANPTTCVGHIADVPCEWTTFAIPQAYHLNISVASQGPLVPNYGYNYGDLLDIWAAANATQSAVLMYWWYPDPTYQLYLGTSAEMQAVQLPPPRQECVTSRVTPEQKCSDTPLADRVGDPRGSCDSEPHSIMKLVVANLFPYLNGVTQITSSGSNDEEENDNAEALPSQSTKWNPALRSPAYEGIKALSINELHLGEIIDAWESKRLDKWNYDPREAVCEWVVDNLPTIQTWIPRTYPRAVQMDDYDHGKEILFGLAQGFGVFCSLLVLGTAALTYYWRKRPLLVFSQVGFLFILLLGLFFVAVGAILEALEPSNVTCVMQHWFIMLGYTLELVPLIVKVSAIHRMMQAARKMRRVTLQRRQLYGTVFAAAFVASILLSIWTAVNPSKRLDQITLHPDRVTEQGETVVTVTYFCASESNSNLWIYLSLAWQLILLLCATVLSVQTRKTRKDLNESSALGVLIYSHFFFVILRCITFVLQGSGEDGNETVALNTLEGLRSLIFSADVFVALNIYFTPKMYGLFKHDDEHFKTLMSLQRRSSVRSLAPRGTNCNSSYNGSIYLNAGSMVEGSMIDRSGHSQKIVLERNASGRSLASASSDFDPSGGSEFSTIPKQSAVTDVGTGGSGGGRSMPFGTSALEDGARGKEKQVEAALPMSTSSVESSCVSISSDENESYRETGDANKNELRSPTVGELSAKGAIGGSSPICDLIEEAMRDKAARSLSIIHDNGGILNNERMDETKCNDLNSTNHNDKAAET